MEYVLNKCLTMKETLRSLLGPEGHLFVRFSLRFSQLALQGGELEWKQPDSSEAGMLK